MDVCVRLEASCIVIAHLLQLSPLSLLFYTYIDIYIHIRVLYYYVRSCSIYLYWLSAEQLCPTLAVDICCFTFNEWVFIQFKNKHTQTIRLQKYVTYVYGCARCVFRALLHRCSPQAVSACVSVCVCTR